MIGRGISYGALSVINAVATGKGAAFGIDLKTEATVEFTKEPGFFVTIDGHPTENTLLAELCAQEMLNRCPESGMNGAVIKTVSDIPISMGLKSSSAAANAMLAAAADALGIAADPLEISRLGSNVAIAAGVSITGAFDDACACMLGGLVFTDNSARELIHRVPMPETCTAVIHLPEFQIRKTAFPKEKMREMAATVAKAYDSALAGDVYSAMYINGSCTCRALGINPEIADRALGCGATAAGLSGTGPATGILVPTVALDEFLDEFGRDNILIANIRNGNFA
ncbi:Homoserine kinase [Methanocorpusculaceae archaeon Sp1]|nr:Homoserine kinase [Methanocorpusculaceae archaeon Sp1]